MKCVVFLAFIALTSAVPLTGWSNTGIGYPETWGWTQYQHPEKKAARQLAQHITQHALHDQFMNTHEAIQNLQGQLQQYQGIYPQGLHVAPWSWTPQYHDAAGLGVAHEVVKHTEPEVMAAAAHYLQEDLQHQFHQLADIPFQPHEEVTHQLQNTIESAIEAELTVDNVHRQQGVYDPTTAGHQAGVFQARIQTLIDQHNEQEIEQEINHHHHWVQQLHHQQQFVNQQNHQIKSQLEHTVSPQHVQQLQLVHHHLQEQEHHLIQEQLAHHLAVLQLQQVLIHRTQQIQEDTVAEHIHENAEQGSHPWFGQGFWFF